MKKFNFHQGQSLIGIIIVLVVAGLIAGGLYYYFSKQITKVPKISEKLVEEEMVKPEEVTPPPEGELPKEKPVTQKCADGTLYGQCSANKPKYCQNGILVNNCSICSCPSNYFCEELSTRCIKETGSKSLELCKKISKEGEIGPKRLLCFAYITNDSSFCEAIKKISNLPYPDPNYYYNNCIADFAQNKNPLLCEKLPEEQKDWCHSISLGAGTIKDPIWCEKIKNLEDKDSCYSNLAYQTKNLNLCEMVREVKSGPVESLRDQCYLNFIQLLHDFPKELICNKIKSQEDREFNCYLQSAIEKSDESICNNFIENPDIKNYCFAVVGRNESLCENFGNATLITGLPLKDSCYHDIGKAKKDLSICDKATGNYRLSCYAWVAEETSNASLCEKSDIYKDNCYQNLAFKLGDVSLCDKIEDEGFKNACYDHLALDKEDATICWKLYGGIAVTPEGIAQGGIAQCIIDVAVKKKDPSVCETIRYPGRSDTEKWYKAECYLKVALVME